MKAPRAQAEPARTVGSALRAGLCRPGPGTHGLTGTERATSTLQPPGANPDPGAETSDSMLQPLSPVSFRVARKVEEIYK